MRKLLLLAAVMITSLMANAQNWSNQILTRADNSGSPVVALNWKYGIGQCIYTANELNLPHCSLSGIGFCLADTRQDDDTTAYEIWLGTTSKTTFTDRYDFVPEAQLTKVFDGEVVHPFNTGTWNYITFDNAFEYDGSSNLVLYMVNKTGAFANDYPFYQFDEGVANSHVIAYNDQAMFRPQNLSDQAGSINSSRPWIKLNYEETYGISVGHTEVTAANAGNITDNLITSGTVTFDPQTNTLTLDNVDASTAEIYANDFNRGDLHIYVTGSCNFKEIWYSKHVATTIYGGTADTLNVGGIAVDDSNSDNVTVTLSGLNVNMTSREAYYRLYGYGRENLVFDNCSFKATADICPVDEFASITLRDCAIVYPVGAVVEDGCIRVNGSHNIDSVCIERVESYGIYVNNIELTSLNADNITDDMITSGTVTFDAETNTLTLDNLNAPNLRIHAYDFYRGDLIINVIGTCSIKSINYSGYRNTTITGGTTDTLYISQILTSISTSYDVTVTLNGLNISMCYDNNYALYGFNSVNLVFDNCHVEARTKVCPVDEFKSISFRDCEIVYPVGAVVEDGCIRLNGDHSIDSLCIERVESGLRLVNATEFSVIPNPAVDVVTISGVELAADGYMTITDASGRRVAAIKIPASESDYTMDVATLPAGVYYITITSGTTRYRSTLIKK